MNPFRKLITSFYRQDESVSANENAVSNSETEVKKFIVRLGNEEIGNLRHGNGQWLFEYTDVFIERVKQGKAKPIIGFPITDKAYISPTLWPFFRIRLPGNYIKAELGRDNIEEVELLEKYGRRSILNPYEVALVG
jgi:hypothetical protein